MRQRMHGLRLTSHLVKPFNGPSGRTLSQVRFAYRFSFQIHEDVVNAACTEEVREALKAKARGRGLSARSAQTQSEAHGRVLSAHSPLSTRAE